MPELTGTETTFEGAYGWAKRLTILQSNHNAQFAVTSWLLFSPRAHPFWSYHTLDVIRLIEVPGTEPAYHAFEGSTHELLVLALQPREQSGTPQERPYTLTECNQLLAENKGLPYLTPPDVVAQLTGTDAEAELLAAYMAWAVANGMLLPDSDYQSWWLESLTETLAHIRGAHDSRK